MRLLAAAALLGLTLTGCSHAPPASPPAAAPALTPLARGELKARADGLVASGKPAEALPLYRQVWAGGARSEGVTYNAACAAALAGERAEALVWLERAVEAGFADAAHLAQDPDLASVRAEPGFARIAQGVAANDAKRNAATEPALRDELLRRVEVDQAARQEAIRTGFKDAAVNARMRAIDEENTRWLEAQVAQGGWPTRTRVGERGAHAAWLLVQHADHHRDFQRACLPLIEAAVAKGEASGKNLAYLTDRVLVADGKPQRYGTQFHPVEGRNVPRPIEDPDGVEARRAAVGLDTMAEYAAQMQRVYGRPAATK